MASIFPGFRDAATAGWRELDRRPGLDIGLITAPLIPATLRDYFNSRTGKLQQ
jgi:hypothetical protein